MRKKAVATQPVRVNDNKKDFLLKYTLLLIISLAINLMPASAWMSSGDSGYPGEYLISMGGGSRGIALGLSQTALNGQENLSYSNPASIASLWWQEASFSFIPVFNQGQFVVAGYGYPLGAKQTISVNLIRLTSGDAEKTNELGESIAVFSDQETAILFGYARKLSEDFHIGANLKLVSQEIDTFSGKGVGLDAGFIYYYVPEHYWALSIINLVPPVIGQDTFPAVAKLGFWRTIVSQKLFWTGDVSIIDFLSTKSNTRWYSGIEYCWPQWFKWRAGINQKQFSAGFGISTKQIDIDYAFVYHPLDFLHSLTLNLRYGFLPSEEEKKIKQDWNRLEAQKAEYLEQKRKEEDDIRFERERLKKDKMLSMKFIEARSLYEEKKYEQSKTMLEEILKENKSDEESKKLLREINSRLESSTIMKRMQEADSFYKRGYFTDALKNVNYVLEIQPDNVNAILMGYLCRAQLYIIDNKYNDAKGELIEVLKMEPNNVHGAQLLKRVQTILDVYGGAEQ